MNYSNPETTVDWRSRKIERILRFDVETCASLLFVNFNSAVGLLRDGRVAHVTLPFDRAPTHDLRQFVLDQARSHNVDSKRIQLLDALPKVPDVVRRAL